MHKKDAEDTTLLLNKKLLRLEKTLSSLHHRWLDITGEIILPPIAVGWQLETWVGKDGLVEESHDDWNSDEGFFRGHETKQIQAEDLGRFRGEHNILIDRYSMLIP